MISVKDDLARLTKNLAKIEAQIPFATALALTRTAKLVQAAEVLEMRDVFDNPTPYTLRSTYIKPATKNKLEATVGIKDEATEAIPPSKYLAPEIAGGGRRLKRFERALRSVGVLPEDYYAVPGSAARLDAYGNISRGQIVSILTYFKTNGLLGFNFNANSASIERRSRRAARKRSAQSVKYFVGSPGDGKLPPGIWERTTFRAGSAIKPIIIFVQHAVYEALFDFPYVARITVEKNFGTEFTNAYAQAVQGAIER